MSRKRKLHQGKQESLQLSAQEFKVLSRHDFYTFLIRCFHELHPEADFVPNWHLDIMAAELDACRQGKIRRQIFCVPPRSLKSIATSVALVAWILGHNPSAKIICASYGQDLADKHSRDTRTIMLSPWYQDLFPATQLTAGRQSVQEFNTTAQGYRMATSVGGVLTGRGADFIIIDDPIKPTEALSDTLRTNCNDWFDHTLYSRLNNKSRGCIIVIMQRLHQDDLVGHLVAQGGWNTRSFPAIAEQTEDYAVETSLGPREYTRLEGEALQPARESLEVLAGIRAVLGEYHFAGQYQQLPVPFGGGMVKLDWFRRYASHEVPGRFDQIVQSWDTANKQGELNDYSVCTTWGIKGKLVYLLDVYRERLNYPDLKRAVKARCEAWSATAVLIEDKASGTQLIQDLVHEGMRQVKGIKPEGGDKVMRMNAQSGQIENGLVLVPHQAAWLPVYLDELTTFPYSKYDDQVDSTSQFLAWLSAPFPGQGMMEWAKREANDVRRRQGLPPFP